MRSFFTDAEYEPSFIERILMRFGFVSREYALFLANDAVAAYHELGRIEKSIQALIESRKQAVETASDAPTAGHPGLQEPVSEQSPVLSNTEK